MFLYRKTPTTLCLLLAISIGSSCATLNKKTSDDAVIAKAKGIHERVITLDTHADFSVGNFTEERNYTMDLPTQVTLPKIYEGGLDVVWLVVYVGQGELTEEGYEQATKDAMAKFDAIHWLAEEKAPDQIEIAYTSDDVRRIIESGKKVAMICLENAYQVGLDLGNIEKFQKLGARYMSLSHNGHSQFSDSNTGERDDVWLHDGLSELGKKAVMEMNKWGIMIDLSHPSKKSNMQVMEMTKAPVIASHSAARKMNDVSRNMDDEQLMALKKNGGVIQTVAFRSYLDSDKARAYRAASDSVRKDIADGMGIKLVTSRREYRQMSAEERDLYQEQIAPVNAAFDAKKGELGVEPVGVNDLVDHIDYLVNKIGIDHVGISSDFDGGGGVEGWSDASETLNVTIELVRRGYSEEEIEKIWSGNLLRVLDEVQRVAAEIQAGG